MELKGIAAKNIRGEKRERMERTLQRMTQRRRDDDMYLRDVVKGKLEWAVAERKKGYGVIDTLNERLEKIKADTARRINELENQIIKLDGIVLVLTELNEIKSEVPVPEPEPKTTHSFTHTKKEEKPEEKKEEPKKETKKKAAKKPAKKTTKKAAPKKTAKKTTTKKSTRKATKKTTKK